MTALTYQAWAGRLVDAQEEVLWDRVMDVALETLALPLPNYPRVRFTANWMELGSQLEINAYLDQPTGALTNYVVLSETELLASYDPERVVREAKHRLTTSLVTHLKANQRYERPLTP